MAEAEIDDDPFAELDSGCEAESAAVVPVGDAVDDAVEGERKFRLPSNLFVFDLETVPDESRFPRPVKVERPPKPDFAVEIGKMLEGTVTKIAAILPMLSDRQLAAAIEQEAAGKNRVGVLKAIADAQSADGGNFEAEFADWKKLAFNPFGCRIVALGIESQNASETVIAKTVDEERALIELLWSYVAKHQFRCGYNITAFDDAVLIARSMILGIDAPKRLERKKFGNRQSVDLMTSLFPASPAMKLKEVCRLIGIVPQAGYEMSGDKVFDYVDAGDWDTVANYVHSDALIEAELYCRLSDYIIF